MRPSSLGSGPVYFAGAIQGRVRAAMAILKQTRKVLVLILRDELEVTFCHVENALLKIERARNIMRNNNTVKIGNPLYGLRIARRCKFAQFSHYIIHNSEPCTNDT
jgi:hypothetical protein